MLFFSIGFSNKSMLCFFHFAETLGYLKGLRVCLGAMGDILEAI